MFDLPQIARGSSVISTSLFEQMHLSTWGTPISIWSVLCLYVGVSKSLSPIGYLASDVGVVDFHHYAMC